MKHVRLLLLSLAILLPALSPGDAEAAPVTPDKAREAAQSFFSGGPSALRQSAQPRLELVWDGESAATRSATDPAFYVYNRTDAPGFVIISGDDRFPSLLGYSFENSFRREGMPENIRSWFAAWRDMILRMRNDVGPLPVKWNAAPRAGTVERLLRTPEWNQSAPFYNDCPIIDGFTIPIRTVTGCVPTAGAIVIKYNRWPDHVSGTVPAYTTGTFRINVPERTLRDYDYELMPDSYGSGYTEAQSAEVARLMADLGSMCEADYGSSGTGATPSALLKALVTYMRYDKQATLAYRKNYTETEWINLMKKEIDADRPVLYGGNGDQGGHQFVMDGCDNRNLFHFNWGWGGYGNGWFYFDAPDYEFKHLQEAIIGLKKDPTGTSEYPAELRLRMCEENGVYYLGLTTTQTVFQTGEPFDVLFGGVENYSDSPFYGELKLAVCDRFGTIKEDLTQPIPVENLQRFQNMVPGAFSCTVRNPIEPGDRIRSYARQHGSEEWVMLRSFYTDLEQQEILLAEDTVGPVDPAEIAAATSLAFDRTTRRMKLCTIYNAVLRIVDANGTVLFEAKAGYDAIEADLTAFAAGEYTLTIGFEAGEPFALRIVL